jgi:replicative DNA helicase
MDSNGYFEVLESLHDLEITEEDETTAYVLPEDEKTPLPDRNEDILTTRDDFFAVTLEKTLPSNVDAEKAIFAAILKNKKHLEQAQMAGLTKEHFYHDSSRRLFEAMCELFRRGVHVEPIALADELKRNGNEDCSFDNRGWPKVLVEMGNLTVPEDISGLIHIVKDKALLRRLIQFSNEVMARGYQAEDHPNDLLKDALKQLWEFAGNLNVEGPVDIEQLVSQAYRDVEDAANQKCLLTGIPTGFDELDKATSGLQPRDLIIIAGRPGMGKTSLALNIAENAAKNSFRTAVFSIEMSKKLIVNRLLCSEGEIDAARFKIGKMNREDWSRLGRAAGLISQLPIHIDDSHNCIDDIRIAAKQLRDIHGGLDLMVVDYLQLARGSKTKQYENRTQEVTEISAALKEIAKEMNVAMIAISQLSRKVEERASKKPILSDLRESGAIEQDADVVLFIYRETGDEYGDGGSVAEIIIGKQRNGPTGTLQLAFISQFTKFANLYSPDGDNSDYSFKPSGSSTSLQPAHKRKNLDDPNKPKLIPDA